uniref:Chemokine interleukin-8-like domain-containing protein n=1 Tax=Oreochromis aureus TaxID=47969 RepID=A0AAZ1XJK2_OREAU
MWTALSVSRWIFLLSLSVVMFFSASQADSVVGLSCCRNVSTRKIARIKWCYEQKPREGCNHHAFLDKPWCVNPNSKWLKDKIQKVT